MLGATFILVTIFLPRGVLGLFEQTFASRRSKPEPAAVPEPEPAE